MDISSGLLYIVKINPIRSVDESAASSGSKVARSCVDHNGFEPNRAGERDGYGKLVIDVGLGGGFERKSLVPGFDDIFGGFGRVEVATPYFVADDVFVEAGGVSVHSREAG